MTDPLIAALDAMEAQLHADAADNICRAYLAYHRARLQNEDGEKCLDLENHAASLAAVWNSVLAPHAGPWLACCEPDFGRELKRLEAESGQDTLMVAVGDYLVEVTV